MRPSKYIETEFKVPESDGNWSGDWLWILADHPSIKSARLETIFIHGPYYLHVQATQTGTRMVRKFCKERGYEECK